jgi:mannosyltransferase OCH1-like enzyme
MNKVIQGLWIGPELSVMEQLSIASFLQNGHEYHLYVYDQVKNIPRGTVVKDANEILPSSKIFQYTQQASYAGFANFFRYKLLLERGGWWADTDIICLETFDFPEPYVFATEICRGLELVSSGIIKAPIGSAVIGHAWEVCRNSNPQQLVWGETGPKLIAEAVRKYSLEHYAKSHGVFCPLGYLDWHRVLTPEAEPVLATDSYAIHLWNEMWRGAKQDKNLAYHPDCLYEQLKQKYLLLNALTANSGG